METPRANASPLGSLSADYGPLVKSCRAFGIGKTRAFELARKGLIRTALLGSRRVVYLESLRTLPERLSEGAQ